MSNALSRELLAEFFGTFILIVFGVGVVAQVVLSKEHRRQHAVDQHRVGSGRDDGLLCVGRRDRCASQPGGHARAGGAPALPVEQGAAVLRSRSSRARSSRRPWCSLPTTRRSTPSTAASVRSLGPQGTAGIWATYPQPFLSVFPGGFIDQVVGTALLVGVIFAITDTRNSPAPAGLAPVVVGLLVLLIGATFGFNSGYAINPARDLGPRLFTFVAGWGGEVFRAGNGWWWVPIVAPCVGGVVGGWAYDVFVGHRFPAAG